MKHSFLPLADDNCTILILGSLPGEMSLLQNQYYAHPRNCFWNMMCEILDQPFVDDYNVRCNMLLKHNIALWDVVGSAERSGSLDSDIKNHTPNDIAGFVHEHKQIKRILLNGGKASNLFKKHFGTLNIETFPLPSTSPAYAGMKIKDKTFLWKAAILGGNLS